MRKGQITIFVIIGIVLLIAIGFISFIYKQIPNAEISSISTNTVSVKLYVESCLKAVAREGFSDMGYGSSNPGFEKDEIERYLKAHIKDNLQDCINDFETLREQGLNITAGTYEATVIVGDTTTILKLNYPLIINDGKLSRISEFEADIPFKYQARRSTIMNIMQVLAPILLSNLLNQQVQGGTQQQSNQPQTNQQVPQTIPSHMSISQLTEMAKNQGFTYNLVYQENADARLTLFFQGQGEEPGFSHTMMIPREEFQEHELFSIQPLPEFYYHGSAMTQTIKPNGNGITFEENSEFVSIGPDGKMTISGSVPQGTSRVLVKATNMNGDSDYAYIIIHN